ncbi:MAG: mechanosensitive ion channel [Erysipelotrichaceae bacterium]|nr:mechanosensitive ion channel [Erysipelotrichaceae bacterium]
MKDSKKRNLIGLTLSLIFVFLLFVFLNPQLFRNIIGESAYQSWVDMLHKYFNLQESDLTLTRWGMALLILAITFALSFAFRKISNLFNFKNQHSNSVKNIVGNVVSFLINLLGVIAALNCLGIDTTALIVSIGIIGVIVGFCVQSVLEDVVSGLMIVLDKTFEVGDYIALDGFRGQVTNIGIRSVKITDEGGNIKVIRNSSIGTLVNLSNSDSYAVVNCSASVPTLEKDEETLKSILEQVFRDNPEIFKAVPEYRGVESVNGDKATLMVVAKVDEKNVYNAKRILNREIAIGMRK